MDKEKQKRIAEIETEMQSADFWSDKDKAQTLLRELNLLKRDDEGEKYAGAVLSILSGAGGDDAEDFSAMLASMYLKYIRRRKWRVEELHRNENNHGGFRNISFEISGESAYEDLKGEAGVHRLVRISPFSAKKLRHTSFSMVEVMPKFAALPKFELSLEEIKIEFAKAGGPGGQNVNKRETAVRAIHLPTGIAVHVSTERSQAQNRERALELLKTKIYLRQEEERKARERGLSISSSTSIEWGNQIRSYVLHPYQLVKDHRTNLERRDIDKVLEGDLDDFIAAEKVQA